jgi:ribonuclease BN (tRNA processing enzyme)
MGLIFYSIAVFIPPIQLMRAGVNPKEIDVIYLTHLHADHTFGIAALLLICWQEGRKKPLFMIGPSRIKNYVKSLMELGYKGLLRKAWIQDKI